MKTLRLFPLEFGRLLRSRLTWLVMLLTVLGPVAGLYLYQPAESTMNSLYLANPAIAGGIIGGILFGLLSIFGPDLSQSGGCSYRYGSVPTDRGLNAAASSAGCCGPNNSSHYAGVAPCQHGANRCGV